VAHAYTLDAVHLLAHQGGWDELLWFAAPIALVVMWVRWAERKARRRVTPPPVDGEAPGTSPTLPRHDDD
jgi:hypothetical protein